MTLSNKKESRFLITMLIVNVIILLTLFFISIGATTRFLTPDSSDYLSLAKHISTSFSYTKGSEPEIFRAPGYPFFLSIFTFISSSLIPIILIQIVIVLGTLFILWHLSLEIFSNNYFIAKVAIITQTISLPSIIFSQKILSETVFTFLLILGCYFLLLLTRDKENRSTKKYMYTVVSGVCFALATFTRAILLPILPLILIYIYWRNRTFKAVILFIIPSIIFIGGWSLRNYAQANYLGFSSVGSINLYRYYAAQLLARKNHISYTKQQQLISQELAKCSSQTEKANYAKRKSIPIILNSSFTFFYLHLKSDINSMLPAIGDLYKQLGYSIGGKGTLGVIQTRGIIAGIKHYFSGHLILFILSIPFIVLLGFKYIGVGCGLFFLIKKRDNIPLFFILGITVYMLLIPGAASHPRFRVPVEPFLALFMAYGLVTLSLFIKNKKDKLNR